MSLEPVAQAGLELTEIFLLQTPKCRDYRREAPCPHHTHACESSRSGKEHWNQVIASHSHRVLQRAGHRDGVNMG